MGVASARPPDPRRTLLVDGGALWLWPGIPLAARVRDSVEALPPETMRVWIARLHGFEADYGALRLALGQAAERLAEGDDSGAQRMLDAAAPGRVSPEGAALVAGVAARLGIAAPKFAVGHRSLPWGAGGIAANLPRFDAFARSAARLEKTWDPERHPRWPADSDDGRGGQFSPAGAAVPGAAGAILPVSAVGAEPANPEGSPEEPPGIGHNGGPPLESPPKIPESPPPTVKLQNQVVKAAAIWLARAAARGATALAGRFLAVLTAAKWLYDNYPAIDAYLDPPQSLEELQQAVQEPKAGYQIHHIVEQTAAAQAGYPRSLIDSPENLVRIPTLKHWEITGWTMRDNEKFGGLSPREYLKDKSWSERYRTGLEGLKKSGVLKP
jgi:hypothetical protein